MNGPGSKPGDEGLPYSPAETVIGGQPDNQPEPGLKPEHEVAGSREVRGPRED